MRDDMGTGIIVGMLVMILPCTGITSCTFSRHKAYGVRVGLTTASPCTKEDTRQLKVGDEVWACVAGQWRVVE